MRMALGRSLIGAGYLWVGGDDISYPELWQSDAVLANNTAMRLALLRGFFGVRLSPGRLQDSPGIANSYECVALPTFMVFAFLSTL